jgi:hypothetical protein
LVLSNAELCSVIVCRDDPDKVCWRRKETLLHLN